jgi:putative phage-type endonuclease
MRTTVPRPANIDDWLSLRHNYVGASEVAALMGEHPFLAAAELAARKLTRTKSAETAETARGHYLEDAVATWWADEHGVEVVEPAVCYVYGDVLIATLDRLAGDEPVEIKTTRDHSPGPRPHWVDQVQAQLLCTGAARAHLVVLDGNLELSSYVIDAEPAHQLSLYRAAERFLGYTRRGELPPDVEWSYRAVTTLYPKAVMPAVELDDDAVSWCHQLEGLQARIRALEDDEDALKARIGVALGDAAEGTHEGRRVVTWRTTTRELLDVKRLRAELPDIASAYRQSSTSRVLRLVKEEHA